MNQKGFSLLEIIISSGILMMVLIGFLTFIGDFNRRAAFLDAEAKVAQEVAQILEGFSLESSCNQMITNALGPLPASVPGLLYPIQELNVNSKKIRVGGTFGANDRGVLTAAALLMEGVVFPNQNVVRGRILIDYEVRGTQKMPNVRRSRSQSVFLNLNAASQVEACFDSKSYRAFEWSEQLCIRLGGIMEPSDRCDLNVSSLVRGRLCEALQFQLMGLRCI